MRDTIRLAAWVALVLCLSAGPAEPPRKAGVPTLWLVGDSTVQLHEAGREGWGQELVGLFDPAKVRVINRAVGGRSSRSFIEEGKWDAVLAEAQKGDFVLIQFGHNDGGPLAGDNRERGSLRGTGDDTKDVTLSLDPNKGKAVTVHSYGWYIRKYAVDSKDKGMSPIVCSWIPHCPRPGDKYEADPKPASYRQWAEESAKASGAQYVDLYGLIWKTYAGKSPEELKTLYFTAGDNTHTNPAGAKHNAEAVVEGIRGLKDSPLVGYFKPADGGAGR